MLKYERLVSVFFLLSIIGCWIMASQSAPVNGASRVNRTMGRNGANKFDQSTAKANLRAKLTTTTTTTTTTTSAAALDDSYDYEEDDKDAPPQADDADYKENEQQYDDDDYADAKSAQSPQTADESEDFIRIKPSPTDDLDPVVQEEETLVRTTSSPTTTSTSPTTTTTTTSTTTTSTTTTTTTRTSASSSPTTPAKHQSSKQAKGNNNTSHEENGDYIFDDEDYYNLAINHFKKADSTNTTLPSTTTTDTSTTTTTKSTTTTTTVATSTTSTTTPRVLSTYKKTFKTAVEPSTRKPAVKDYDQNEDDALYEDEYADTAVRLTPNKQIQPAKAKPAPAQVNVISKKLNSNQMLIDPTVSATATTSQVKVVSNRPSSGNNGTREKGAELESVPDEYYDYNNDADESQQPGRSNNRTNGGKGTKPDDEYDYSNDANDYYDDYGDDYTNEETDPDEDYYETDVKDKSTDAQHPQNEQNYEYYDELGGAGGGVDSNATKSPSVVTTLNLTSLVASSATVSGRTTSSSSTTSQTTTTASSTTTQMTTTTTPPPPTTTTTTAPIMTGSSSTSTTIKSTDLNYDTYTDMEIEIDDSVTDPNGDYEDYHGDDVDLTRSSSRKPQLDGKSKDPSGNSTSTFITTLTWRDLIKSPALLAGIFGGLLVGIITALLLLVFIIYRMKRRKKDESTYIINGTLKSANLHYQPNGAGAIGGNIRSYRTHHAAQHVTLLSSSSISPNANVTAGSSASSSSSSSSSSASSASSATTGLLNGTTTTSTRILKYTKTNSLRKTASVLSSDSAASSPNHDGSFNYAYIKAPTKEFYA